MTRFERVVQILDESVNGDVVGGHRAFWRGLDREQFKARRVFGRQLVVPSDVGHSNLVSALRGTAPFGADLGVPDADYPRMPVGYPPVAEDRIVFIEQWIADGCPDDEWPQSEK